MTDDSIAPDVFEHLRKATLHDPAELTSLFRDYLAEARKTLAQMRSAFAQAEAEQVRRQAHHLRGSSLVIGATMVARCCAALEMMDSDSKFRDAEPLLDQTSAALDAVETALAHRLGPSVVPVEGSAA